MKGGSAITVFGERIEPVKYFKEDSSWLQLTQRQRGNFCSQAIQMTRGMVVPANAVTDEDLAQIH